MDHLNSPLKKKKNSPPMIFYNYCYWAINLIGFLMANGKSFSVGRVEKWFSYRANAHRHAKSHKLKRTRLKFFDRHSD